MVGFPGQACHKFQTLDLDAFTNKSEALKVYCVKLNNSLFSHLQLQCIAYLSELKFQISEHWKNNFFMSFLEPATKPPYSTDVKNKHSYKNNLRNKAFVNYPKEVKMRKKNENLLSE